MALVKGPFTIIWGDLNDNAAIVHDVEELDISVDVETNDYTTVDGKRYTLYGAISASATLTLLDSNVDVLTALLPQYTKTGADPDNNKMSSGETVNKGYVAIDYVAKDCLNAGQGTAKDLHIISCSNNHDGSTTDGHEIITIKACSTSLTEIDLPDNQLRTVQITFTGEPGNNSEGGAIAAVQMYRRGALSASSSSS